MADASGEGRKERRETVERRSFAAVIGCVLDSMKGTGPAPSLEQVRKLVIQVSARRNQPIASSNVNISFTNPPSENS
ncbi:hypothetical protein ACDY99_30945, partial [Achromobacter dolens]|uniref:hypothetical protein n=1 Tax=Achromobacter dolens TaxID=1287738 RepID=UPI003556667C